MLLFVIAMSIAISCSILGDFFVQQGATAAKSSTNTSFLGRFFNVFRHRKMLIAVGLLTCHFAGYTLAMRLAPVTVVVPLMSCTYIVNIFLARTVLHEQVTRLRWAGVAVIVFGVIVLGIWS
ncbi:MAG: hypothetical protein JOZ78_19865 [Chroococcidiopsidaceae cyanobacterium CP_BM_ER_R8_30]|nr:hypothetical protein [Chroococcidiopsidaceae cyanobacterium CP_BM_ER_R8_30]